jgi:hypothetical protein
VCYQLLIKSPSDCCYPALFSRLIIRIFQFIFLAETVTFLSRKKSAEAANGSLFGLSARRVRWISNSSTTMRVSSSLAVHLIFSRLCSLLLAVKHMWVRANENMISKYSVQKKASSSKSSRERSSCNAGMEHIQNLNNTLLSTPIDRFHGNLRLNYVVYEYLVPERPSTQHSHACMCACWVFRNQFCSRGPSHGTYARFL